VHGVVEYLGQELALLDHEAEIVDRARGARDRDVVYVHHVEIGQVPAFVGDHSRMTCSSMPRRRDLDDFRAAREVMQLGSRTKRHDARLAACEARRHEVLAP
jgi:hypothetical protein